MSEQNPEVPPVNTPPANNPPNDPPKNDPPQNPPSNPPANQGFDPEKFLTALNALPETIAKSVKEAIGTPAPAPANTPPKNDPPKETEPKGPGAIPKGEAQPGKGTGTAGERFRQWWFK